MNGFVDVFVKRVATRDFIKRTGGRISIKLVEEGEARDSQIVFFFFLSDLLFVVVDGVFYFFILFYFYFIWIWV